MRLSIEAYKYLDKLVRNKDFVLTDTQLIIDYLRNQNIQPSDKIIEFQKEFSGFKLTITGKPKSTFTASLFSKNEISQNLPVVVIEIDALLYFDCGEHATAQFWFVIGSSGQICTYNNNDETVNIIFSSFDKFIESYAYEDFLAQNRKYEDPSYYNLIDNNSFEVLTEGFIKHATANDSYNKWLLHDNLIIHKGTWFDNPGNYIHIYGDDVQQCDSFIKQLKNKQIIS